MNDSQLSDKMIILVLTHKLLLVFQTKMSINVNFKWMTKFAYNR